MQSYLSTLEIITQELDDLIRWLKACPFPSNKLDSFYYFFVFNIYCTHRKTSSMRNNDTHSSKLDMKQSYLHINCCRFHITIQFILVRVNNITCLVSMVLPNIHQINYHAMYIDPTWCF